MCAPGQCTRWRPDLLATIHSPHVSHTAALRTQPLGRRELGGVKGYTKTKLQNLMRMFILGSLFPLHFPTCCNRDVRAGQAVALAGVRDDVQRVGLSAGQTPEGTGKVRGHAGLTVVAGAAQKAGVRQSSSCQTP